MHAPFALSQSAQTYVCLYDDMYKSDTLRYIKLCLQVIY